MRRWWRRGIRRPATIAGYVEFANGDRRPITARLTDESDRGMAIYSVDESPVFAPAGAGFARASFDEIPGRSSIRLVIVGTERE